VCAIGRNGKMDIWNPVDWRRNAMDVAEEEKSVEELNDDSHCHLFSDSAWLSNLHADFGRHQRSPPPGLICYIALTSYRIICQYRLSVRLASGACFSLTNIICPALSLLLLRRLRVLRRKTEIRYRRWYLRTEAISARLYEPG